MNLRIPIVTGIVAVAAGAAALRAVHPAPSAPAFTESMPALRAAGTPRSRHAPASAPGAHRIVVYVAGQVTHAGVYALPASARGIDALRAAGGAAPSADLVAVNLAAPLADGDEIAVPRVGDVSVAARRVHRGANSLKRSRSPRGRHKRKRHRPLADAAVNDGSRDAPADLVDPNTADVEALQTLPGIGPALAERIVAVRDQSGPFAAPDDLLDVGGMTQSKLDAIAPYLILH